MNNARACICLHLFTILNYFFSIFSLVSNINKHFFAFVTFILGLNPEFFKCKQKQDQNREWLCNSLNDWLSIFCQLLENQCITEALLTLKFFLPKLWPCPFKWTYIKHHSPQNFCQHYLHDNILICTHLWKQNKHCN